MIAPAVLEIAENVLTPAQLEAWRMQLDGYSQRAISYHLDVGRTTVTDRLDGAWRALRRHGVLVTPDGRPYLSEPLRTAQGDA